MPVIKTCIRAIREARGSGPRQPLSVMVFHEDIPTSVCAHNTRPAFLLLPPMSSLALQDWNSLFAQVEGKDGSSYLQLPADSITDASSLEPQQKRQKMTPQSQPSFNQWAGSEAAGAMTADEQNDGSRREDGLSVFSAAIGRSFYSRLFPDRYLHLGVSFTALHWISSKPDVYQGPTFYFNDKW